MRRAQLRVSLTALVLAGAGLCATPLSPAQALPAATCSSSNGVSVIVDTGSSISSRCVAGDPGSGLQALSGAGYSYIFPRTQPGFVCRINWFPSSDPCVNTPPASAYWSYWHAKPGGGWTYSSLGAASYNPAPGTVEGWSFGSGQPPRMAPPRLPVTATTTPKPTTVRTTATVKPAPKPTQPATVRPTTAPAAPGLSGLLAEGSLAPGTTSAAGGAGPTTGESSAPGATTPGATSGTSTTGTPSSSSSAAPTEEASLPVESGVVAASGAQPPTTSAAANDGSGSLSGLAAGGAVLAALAGGIVIAVRRRAAESAAENAADQASE